MAAFVSIDNLVAAAIDATGVGLHDLRDTARRPRRVSLVRAAVALIAQSRTDASTRQTAAALGLANPKSVWRHQNQRERRLRDPQLRRVIADIESRL